MQKVSIIIPFYNEEKGIAYLKERLSPVLVELSKSFQTELILVDDGSSDETNKLLREHFPQANLIVHPKNRGLGAAMRSGFGIASGDFIGCLDADCTYAPADLIPMLKIMRASPRIDILIASQYHPQGGVKDIPAWRLFFSRGASRLYRLILPRKLYTYTGFMRVYRRQVVRQIDFVNDGFIAVTEVLVRAIYRGYNIVEFPTTLSKRIYGKSKIKVLRVILEHLKFILKIKW